MKTFTARRLQTVLTILMTVLSLASAPAILAAPAAATVDDSAERRLEAAYRFALGKLLAEEGDYEAARQAYLNALELDDSDPYVYLELTRLHSDLADVARSREIRFERFREAAVYAGDALRRAPANPDVLRLYGRIHLNLAEVQTSSVGEAVRAFEALLEQQPRDLRTLVSLGQIYLWQRDVPNAARVLLDAARHSPRNRVVHRMLLDALQQSSQGGEEMEPLLTALLEMDPGAVENRLALADVFAQREDHHRAIEVLESAPAKAAADPRLRERLAMSLHRIGEDARALELVEALHAGESPRPGMIKRLRISILSALARYEDAIAAMADWQPADAATRRDRHLLLSRLYERVGRTDEALASLETALEQAEDADVLGIELRLAGALERHGRVERAVDRLRARLATAEKREDRALLTSTLAELLHRAGRTGEGVALLEETIADLSATDAEIVERLRVRKLGLLVAAEDWPRLLEQAPPLMDGPAGRSLVARVAYAEALAHDGRVDEGLALLAPGEDESSETRRQLLLRRVSLAFDHDREPIAEKLITGLAESGSPEDLYLAAQLWQQGERYPRMIPLLDRVLEAEPGSTRVLFSLAAAYERTGDVARAAATFERLLELAPDHAQSLNYLGYMWADRGENLDRALALIRRAVALDPDNGAYVDSLGWAYYRLGDYRQARQQLEWAARLVDDDPTVFEHLGDLYLALDQRERARESYRQALELADEPETLRQKLEQLDQEL